MTAVRVANCAGWLWDRFSGLRDALAGPVDVVTGDYLAEPTLRQLALERQKDPAAGYARSFLAQFTDAVDLLVSRGARLVVDAGGLNPAGLAAQCRRVIAEAGHDLVVAHVEGDDVLGRLADLGPLEHLDSPPDGPGRPLADWGHDPGTANAYLGGWGITAALAAGADVVVTGRVTDASLTTGVAAWWHGWSVEDTSRRRGTGWPARSPPRTSSSAARRPPAATSPASRRCRESTTWATRSPRSPPTALP